MHAMILQFESFLPQFLEIKIGSKFLIQGIDFKTCEFQAATGTKPNIEENCLRIERNHFGLCFDENGLKDMKSIRKRIHRLIFHFL